MKSNKKKGPSTPKINPTRCPEGITLEEWQQSLRRQAAQNESFGIRRPFSQGDPFIVTSAKSGRTYRVCYYGDKSSLNRCECMDFKTNSLGTCKHIEAISQYSNGKYKNKTYPKPTNTYVYLDYTEGRKIKIYFGSSASEEIRELATGLFDNSGILKDMSCDPSEFIRKAMKIDEGFVWEPDAMDLLIETRNRIRRREIIARKYKESSLDGLIKTRLHPYQADGVRFAFAEGRTINADEMGLGKTVQAIATAELLKRECTIESVIIICPTSLKYQWLAEIRRFSDSSVIVVEGNILKRKEQLTDPRYFYKICSFHALTNTIKGGFIPPADMIIYDELQRLKNRDTQMGKQLRKLKTPYVLALSGTPLENKLDELYSVTQFADQYALGPYYKFTADTTLTDSDGKVTGYRNLHSISEKLKKTLIRRKKSDVRLQMPVRTDTNLFVPMTKEQQAIHDDYKFQVGIIIQKWRRHKFLSEADRKRLLLFLSMMRMVCDSTFILDQKTRHDTKIDEILAIVHNMLDEGNGKVVIFSQWERMLRILANELQNEDIDFCFLHGGVPSPKRKILIDSFRDDPDCRIFLSTDAGATGLNLQAASLLINIDLPWNPAVLEQRIARIYRLGQENPVQIINMVASDTIEERMLSTLRFKSNLAAGILDGGDDAVFIEGSKFDKIVEVVDEVFAEPEQSPEQVSEEVSTDSPATESHKNTTTPTDEKQKPAEPAESTTKKLTETSSSEMRDIIADGLGALSKIANALRDPEGVKSIADALVKEDPETGHTSINIPVPDKTAVINILSAFSTLLNR